jgi:hypothetical protein
MTNERGLVVKENGSMSIADLRTLAGDFAKSGYFADAREMVQAVVKIQAGLEMGLPPVYSMTKIYIVKGKVMVSAEAMGALIKRTNRYDYTVKQLTDDECVLVFTDNGREAYTSKFTMKDATRADLVKGDSGWSKWPRAMLMSKALSQGARIVCPHVIAGAYTPADFGVETGEDGEPKPVIESTATVQGPTETMAALKMITEAQTKKIWVLAKEKGQTEGQIHQFVERLQCHHLTDLTAVMASNLIDHLVALPDTPQQAPTAPAEAATTVEGTTTQPDNGNALETLCGLVRVHLPHLKTDKNVTSWLSAGPHGFDKERITSDPMQVWEELRQKMGWD